MDVAAQDKIRRIIETINRTNDKVNEINHKIDQLIADGTVTDPNDHVDFPVEELHTALDQIEGNLVLLENRLQQSLDRLHLVH